ncbi:MAG: hypothetical protein NTZ59_02895 [Bacteroidetes bacterium]|nr:hypothetical protein [Bacteroidota bacterium]
MKKITIFIFCIATLQSFSQKRTTQFSITGEGAVMATKQAFSVYNAGFGGSGKVLFPTGKKNYFTATLGVMAFSGRSGPVKEIFKEVLGNTTIPEPYNTAFATTNVAHPPLTLVVPKIGYKYFINNKLNAEVEAGYCFATVKKLFESIPGNVGGYDFSLGFGFLVTKKIDIGFRYEQFESTASEKDFTAFVALRTLINIDFK